MKKYKTKYGEFSSIQLKEYKQRLHSQVHWLLVCYEEYHDSLEKYFEKLQNYLNGLDEVICYPAEMIELIATIETARLEFCKPDCNFVVYRKLILDSHSIIDRLPEFTRDGDENE